ncbi:uncharacterized protein LOC116410923 [Xenopus tropicalis]|uniref:Uncharacterized protein LOC116410923 n=1 Tax=Xenopus tropicalis TaxID=8364 RepID=A0A8J1JKL7_XENTR|nr:uncharacterized protein LOC116410923 [Xenopus tropicalis]
MAFNCNYIYKDYSNQYKCQLESSLELHNLSPSISIVAVKNENLNIFISISADRTTGKPCQPCTDYHKCLNEMLHCKDQDLQVAEGEDLKFDCNVKFLNNIGGNLEFVLEKKDESGISPLKSVNKHDILIHKVDKEFSGRYTCTAKSKDSMFPISRVDFTVKVVSAPKPQSLGSSLSPPAEEMKDAFKDNQLAQITVICATVISLAITASIMTCICLLIRERKREEKASAQKELEEVKISTDIKKSKPGTREKATQTDV